MLILDADQLDFCRVSYGTGDTLEILPGARYRNKLFRRLEQFPLPQDQDAIQRARQIYIQTKGEYTILVVKGRKDYSIWQEDKTLQVWAVADAGSQVKALDLEQVVARMRNVGGVEIRDRIYHLKNYPRCFVAQEAVTWFAKHLGLSIEEAIALGQRLIDEKWIHHVTDDHQFENDFLFYRFYWDEPVVKA